MGKHKGSHDSTEWNTLTPSQKGEEFDKSIEDPRGYAQENFQGTGGGGEAVYGGGSRHQEYRDENDRNNRRK